MPRKFCPQNLRETDRSNLEAAFKYKVTHNTTIRKAAHKFGVKVMTLQDAFKRSNLKSDGVTYVSVQDNFNKIFTDAEESMLCEYAIQRARLFNGMDGMSRKDFRLLVYEYAVACKCTNIPEKWHITELASENWYYSFMDRYPNIALKRPISNQQDSSCLPNTNDAEVPTYPISPKSVRPYPEVPPRPQGKGKPRVEACSLTKDPAAIQKLIDKEAKKEKRKAAKEKKQTGSRPKAAKKPAPLKSLTKGRDDDSDSNSLIKVDSNDSLQYSDKDFTNEPQPVEETNIFQDKAPEVGDYLLVELPVEEGRTKGTRLNYIAKVLVPESAENPGIITVSFMRKSKKMGDMNTFIFPTIEDKADVKFEQVKGVLFAPLPALTPRLKRFVRFQHSLASYNVK